MALVDAQGRPLYAPVARRAGYRVYRILPREDLWIGGEPPDPGHGADRLPFDVLILCAAEIQPQSDEFPRVGEVLHCGFDDRSPAKTSDLNMAMIAAQEAVKALEANKSVLVTCHAGLNRSGLVCALTLVFGYGMDARRAIATVKRSRGPEALTNSAFNAFLPSAKRLWEQSGRGATLGIERVRG